MKLPVISTILVSLAVAAMIALGVWQLDRRGQKEAAIAQFATNIGRPAVAFPARGVGDAALFRRSSVDCTGFTGWTRESGRAANGGRGWRVIATCARADGVAVPVQLGVANSAAVTPAWRGGVVTGHISHAPDHRALIQGAFDRTPKRLMLVAATPPAGLAANPGPDLSSVPNNHLAYAVQWFLFAGIAAVIYLLAVRRRNRTS